MKNIMNKSLLLVAGVVLLGLTAPSIANGDRRELQPPSLSHTNQDFVGGGLLPGGWLSHTNQDQGHGPGEPQIHRDPRDVDDMHIEPADLLGDLFVDLRSLDDGGMLLLVSELTSGDRPLRAADLPDFLGADGIFDANAQRIDDLFEIAARREVIAPSVMVPIGDGLQVGGSPLDDEPLIVIAPVPAPGALPLLFAAALASRRRRPR